jgi:hypothetical protein
MMHTGEGLLDERRRDRGVKRRLHDISHLSSQFLTNLFFFFYSSLQHTRNIKVEKFDTSVDAQNDHCDQKTLGSS